MSKLFTRLAMLLVGLFIAGGLAFGATQAFASSSSSTCGDDLGEIGLCPPFIQASCNAECALRFGIGGACLTTETNLICCTCII